MNHHTQSSVARIRQLEPASDILLHAQIECELGRMIAAEISKRHIVSG